MKASSSNIFDDYIKAAKLKNASLRYCFARDVFEQVSNLTEKFDFEIQTIIQSLIESEKKQNDSVESVCEELALSVFTESNNEASEFDESQLDENSSSDKQESPELLRLKRLFKQIAIRCHPDKLMNKDFSSREFHFLLSCYETAREALEDDNEPSMVCTGIDLQIVGDLGADGSFKLLSNAAEGLEKKSEELRQSALWVWGSIDNNTDAKTKVLCNILKQFYGMNIPENNVKKAVIQYFGNKKNDEEDHIPPRHSRRRRRVGIHPGANLRQRRNNDG